VDCETKPPGRASLGWSREQTLSERAEWLSFVATTYCFRGGTTDRFGGGKLTLAISDIDALPSENASVDRPSAGPERGQGSTDTAQEDVSPGISGLRESTPQLNAHHECPGDRRP
jgi:hypothetical protein